jgi:hypothetical protein
MNRSQELPPENWHRDTIASFKKKPDEQLRYIIKDCREAAKAGIDLYNPKVGQYLDTALYAEQELANRRWTR